MWQAMVFIRRKFSGLETIIYNSIGYVNQTIAKKSSMCNIFFVKMFPISTKCDINIQKKKMIPLSCNKTKCEIWPVLKIKNVISQSGEKI